MPPLNKFDEFEACMQIYGEKAKYCYVKTAIKPDPSSELSNFIIKFSSRKKQHFRHDKLTRGVCVDACKELLLKLNTSDDDYYVSEFKMDYEVIKSLWLVTQISSMSCFYFSDQFRFHRFSQRHRVSSKVQPNHQPVYQRWAQGILWTWRIQFHWILHAARKNRKHW